MTFSELSFNTIQKRFFFAAQTTFELFLILIVIKYVYFYLSKESFLLFHLRFFHDFLKYIFLMFFVNIDFRENIYRSTSCSSSFFPRWCWNSSNNTGFMFTNSIKRSNKKQQTKDVFAILNGQPARKTSKINYF